MVRNTVYFEGGHKGLVGSRSKVPQGGTRVLKLGRMRRNDVRAELA